MLITKISIYTTGDHPADSNVSKFKLLGEQIFGLDDLIKGGAFSTKPLINEKRPKF